MQLGVHSVELRPMFIEFQHAAIRHIKRNGRVELQIGILTRKTVARLPE